MQVCSQPWVTATSWAVSRDANVRFDLNTRQSLPLPLPSPLERWTEKEARKRPQSVGFVVGETTYLPMETA